MIRKFMILEFVEKTLKCLGYAGEVRSDIHVFNPAGLISRPSLPIALLGFLGDDRSSPVCLNVSQDSSLVPVPEEGELILYEPDTGQIRMRFTKDETQVFGPIKFNDRVEFLDDAEFFASAKSRGQEITVNGDRDTHGDRSISP